MPCRSISALISSSLASGPSTSAVGNPANSSSLAPYSMPVICMSLPPEFARAGRRSSWHYGGGADAPRDRCRKLSRRRPPAHIAGAHVVLVDRAVDPGAQSRREVLPAHMLQHQRGCQQQRHRIGDALARRCRAPSRAPPRRSPRRRRCWRRAPCRARRPGRPSGPRGCRRTGWS